MRTPVGLLWYHRGDYQQVRRLCADARRLPESFDAWLDHAGALCRQIEAQGGLVLKIHLDPRAFRDWCAERGIMADEAARARFEYETTQTVLAAAPPISCRSGRWKEQPCRI